MLFMESAAFGQTKTEASISVTFEMRVMQEKSIPLTIDFSQYDTLARVTHVRQRPLR